MADMKASFIAQLDSALVLFEEIKRRTQYEDFGDIGFNTLGSFTAAAIASIDRVAGPDSTYGKQARSFNNKGAYVYAIIPYLAGFVQTLRHDVNAGFLISARELIHGEIFGDFLEMAEFLLNEGYKDAGAVMEGGVLEIHLRQLCIRHSIPVESAPGRPKKADTMNADLAGASAYSKLDQKNVTAWLDLRNKAAHAKYTEYSKEQVALFLQNVRDFITRCPA